MMFAIYLFQGIVAGASVMTRLDLLALRLTLDIFKGKPKRPKIKGEKA